VHILVYRGGAMARLGHNHALSSQSVTGDLHLHPDLSKTQLRLSLPVASLDVDDAAVRATEGEDFAASVPQDAREGTKRNLLRADVLDAEHFPTIDLQASAVAGTRNAPQLTMRIALKGVTRELLVPVTVEESGSTLVAAGEFSIKQTDFGITPFSVALGALQVQDAVRIRFRLVAEKK
jgi:polyisoprenoid-binding protein YceI